MQTLGVLRLILLLLLLLTPFSEKNKIERMSDFQAHPLISCLYTNGLETLIYSQGKIFSFYMLRLTKHTSSNFMCRALFPPVVSSECSKLQRWAITDRRMCHEARTLSKTEGPNTHPPHPPWRTNNAVASHPTDVWFGTSIRLPILLGSTPIG